MRAALFAVLVIFAFVAGKYVIAAADKAKNRQEVIAGVVDEIFDCHKTVYDKDTFTSIRDHLYPPENKFYPTSVQMVDSSSPTAKERKLLAQYNEDVKACKATETDKIKEVAPEMEQKLNESLSAVDTIMQRLISGSITWGEAAHLSENLRRQP